jgi:hypothetical protein
VEVRAAGVHPGDRIRDVVVGRETLRGRDALEDSRRRARTVAADRQDALAAVGERDPEDGGAIDPRPVIDIVDERWRGRALWTRVDPADQPGDRVGAASATEVVQVPPPVAALDPPPPGRDEGAGPGERDRVAPIRGRRRGVSAGVEGPGGTPVVLMMSQRTC